MSKSKGNIVTVSTLEDAGYNPLSYRLMCLMSHYKKIMEFTYEGLDAAQNAYNKLTNKISSIQDEGDFQDAAFKDYNEKFMNELSNDLNTANALTVMYDLLKDTSINGKTKLELVRSFDKVLGLDLIKEKKESTLHPQHDEIVELIEARNKFKLERNFTEADSIRAELLKKGIELIDTREGTIYKVKD